MKVKVQPYTRDLDFTLYKFINAHYVQGENTLYISLDHLQCILNIDPDMACCILTPQRTMIAFIKWFVLPSAIAGYAHIAYGTMACIHTDFRHQRLYRHLLSFSRELFKIRYLGSPVMIAGWISGSRHCMPEITPITPAAPLVSKRLVATAAGSQWRISRASAPTKRQLAVLNGSSCYIVSADMFKVPFVYSFSVNPGSMFVSFSEKSVRTRDGRYFKVATLLHHTVGTGTDLASVLAAFEPLLAEMGMHVVSAHADLGHGSGYTPVPYLLKMGINGQNLAEKELDSMAAFTFYC